MQVAVAQLGLCVGATALPCMNACRHALKLQLPAVCSRNGRRALQCRGSVTAQGATLLG
jgi:hypothetical protein